MFLLGYSNHRQPGILVEAVELITLHIQRYRSRGRQLLCSHPLLYPSISQIVVWFSRITNQSLHESYFKF